MRLLPPPIFPYIIITHNEPITADLLAQRCDLSASFSCNPIFYLCCICHSEEREEKEALYDTHRCANAVNHLWDMCRSPTISPSDYTHYTQLISWFLVRRLYDVMMI